MSLLATIIADLGRVPRLQRGMGDDGRRAEQLQPHPGSWLYKSAFFNDQFGYASTIAVVIFVITMGAAIVQLIIARGRMVQF